MDRTQKSTCLVRERPNEASLGALAPKIDERPVAILRSFFVIHASLRQNEVRVDVRQMNNKLV